MPPPREPLVRINSQIRAPQVRVIDADGRQIGILSVRDALKAAEGRGLDLVEVAPTAQPPVCRITNFDKYRYAQKKKLHDSRKAAVSLIKEVKMGSQTGQHDVEFKVKHIKRFVEEGHRVKLSVSFRGRAITHPELGRALIERIIEQVKDAAQPEGLPRMEGRNISVLLTPK